MNSELSYNVANLENLAGELNASLADFEQNVADMFSVINGTLPTYWEGSAYNAFKANCEAYRVGKIEPLINDVKNWAKNIDDMAARAADTTTKNTNIFS